MSRDFFDCLRRSIRAKHPLPQVFDRIFTVRRSDTLTETPGKTRSLGKSSILAAVVSLWFLLILSGAHALLRYESTPGAPGTPPAIWPSRTGIVRPPGKFTLVMLSHPDCPCTRASLAELESVIARTQGQLVGFIVFSKPGSSRAEIESSDLWHLASRIPAITPLDDQRGTASQKFHGYVSGQTMLYDPAGRLIFSGGITSGRGHQGDNAGAEAVIRRVNGDGQAPKSAAVFGCALHNPNDQTAKEDPSWRQ